MKLKMESKKIWDCDILPAAWLAESKSKSNAIRLTLWCSEIASFVVCFFLSLNPKQLVVIHSLFSHETKAIIDFIWTGFRKQWNLLLHVLCNSTCVRAFFSSSFEQIVTICEFSSSFVHRHLKVMLSATRISVSNEHGHGVNGLTPSDRYELGNYDTVTNRPKYQPNRLYK